MACECITKIQNAIREESGDPEAMINVGFKHDKVNNTLGVRPTGLVVRHRTRNKKNGEWSQRQVAVPLSLNYCPWCGTKYE